MKLRFKDNKLLKAYQQEKERLKRFELAVAQKYPLRVATLEAITALDDLRSFPNLRLHPLKGERAGQWSIDIHDRWRLVFEIEGDELVIIEVSNHYGD